MAEEERHFEVRTVEQLGVWSLAKILGLMGILAGLLLAVPALLIGGMFGVGGSVGQFVILIGGAGFYGVFGGAVIAVVYNLAAEFVGGIEIYLNPQ